MAKSKYIYTCNQCGFESSKWNGKCPSCGAWNSFEEELAESLPLQYKVQAPRTKVALRAAAERSIRNKTAEKKKLGFPIPIRVWLKEEKYYNRVRAMFASSMAKKFFNTDLLMKMLEDHRDGKNTNEKTDDSRKIWTVYIFLVWYDRFFEHGKPVHPSMTAGK